MTVGKQLGMKTLGAALSVRPGEIHLADLRRQISADDPDIGSIAVLALQRDGAPQELELRFTTKWSTRGWEKQLACPICGEPSRVLREHDGNFCCARCAPRSSAHHRLKNNRYWRDGGKTTAAIVRELMPGSRSGASPLLHELAISLMAETIERAEAVIPPALAALEYTNQIKPREQAE